MSNTTDDPNKINIVNPDKHPGPKLEHPEWDPFAQEKKYWGPSLIPDINIQEALNKLEVVEEKLDALHRKMDLIFGSNIILGGRFVDLLALEKKIKEEL